LLKTGSLETVKDQLASFEMRQNAVRKGDFDEMERRYT